MIPNSQSLPGYMVSLGQNHLVGCIQPLGHILLPHHRPCIILFLVKLSKQWDVGQIHKWVLLLYFAGNNFKTYLPAELHTLCARLQSTVCAQ